MTENTEHTAFILSCDSVIGYKAALATLKKYKSIIIHGNSYEKALYAQAKLHEYFPNAQINCVFANLENMQEVHWMAKSLVDKKYSIDRIILPVYNMENSCDSVQSQDYHNKVNVLAMHIILCILAGSSDNTKKIKVILLSSPIAHTYSEYLYSLIYGKSYYQSIVRLYRMLYAWYSTVHNKSVVQIYWIQNSSYIRIHKLLVDAKSERKSADKKIEKIISNYTIKNVLKLLEFTCSKELTVSDFSIVKSNIITGRILCTGINIDEQQQTEAQQQWLGIINETRINI